MVQMILTWFNLLILVLEFLVKRVILLLNSLITLFLSSSIWEDWCSGTELNLVTTYCATFTGASWKLVWIQQQSSICRLIMDSQVSRRFKAFCSGLSMFFWQIMQVLGICLTKLLVYAIMAGTMRKISLLSSVTITFTIVKKLKSSIDTSLPKSSYHLLLVLWSTMFIPKVQCTPQQTVAQICTAWLPMDSSQCGQL